MTFEEFVQDLTRKNSGRPVPIAAARALFDMIETHQETKDSAQRFADIPIEGGW